MEKKILIWIVIGILLLAVIYLTFFRGGVSGAASVGGTGKIDTTGWTANEIMNYEMHGVVPARAGVSGASTGSSGGMVGGC